MTKHQTPKVRIKSKKRRKQPKPVSCTKLVIPRSVMHRLVRELVQDRRCDGRVTEEATNVLHTEAERFLHEFLSSCAATAAIAGRDTITVADSAHVMRLRAMQ